MKPHNSIDHLIQVMMDGGEKAFDIVPTILGRVIEERSGKRARIKTRAIPTHSRRSRRIGSGRAWNRPSTICWPIAANTRRCSG